MGVYGTLYLTLVGGSLVIGAFVQIARTIRFFNNSIETTGVIIALEAKEFRYKTYFYPRIEFYDENNNPTTFIGGLGQRLKKESYIGRNVKVRYLRNEAKEDELTARLWTLPTVLAGPAAFLVLGGLLLAVAARSY